MSADCNRSYEKVLNDMATNNRASRQRQGYRDRRQPGKTLRQRFLIVCEGEKTEPNYFQSFSAPKEVVALEVHGLGLDPLHLVQEALDRQKKAVKSGLPYDQVWCVFDRDDWPVTLFNNALSHARRSGISVAYSNEAFELWYLLHFNYYDTACSRSEYQDRLTTQLGKTYRKNAPDMYDRLRDRQTSALRNAERLLSQYEPCHPANDNPSTTVHLLVQELNKHARP